ncbi:hypothetical protein J1614_004841 [Plenodomus biglobosus]|nr:hypothetical protein J1614_004841 [Plenodomus biglobosus]
MDLRSNDLATKHSMLGILGWEVDQPDHGQSRSICAHDPPHGIHGTRLQHHLPLSTPFEQFGLRCAVEPSTWPTTDNVEQQWAGSHGTPDATWNCGRASSGAKRSGQSVAPPRAPLAGRASAGTLKIIDTAGFAVTCATAPSAGCLHIRRYAPVCLGPKRTQDVAPTSARFVVERPKRVPHVASSDQVGSARRRRAHLVGSKAKRLRQTSPRSWLKRS